MPANLPTTGVNLIIHEADDSFLVIYSNASTLAGARFKLGPNSVSSSILMDSPSFQALDFASMASVQNSESDYFLGPAPVRASTHIMTTIDLNN